MPEKDEVFGVFVFWIGFKLSWSNNTQQKFMRNRGIKADWVFMDDSKQIKSHYQR